MRIDLVTGVSETEQGVEHRVALAAGDDDLPPSVVARPATALDVGGNRLLEVVTAGER